MCMYLNSEIILTNILHYYKNSSDGITQELIERYCQNVRKIISYNKKYTYDYIFFQNNEMDMEKTTLRFPKQFSRFMGCYYRGCGFNGKLFTYNMPKIDDIKNILKQAAKML